MDARDSELLNVATEHFEKRLGHEVTGLGAALRKDMATLASELRGEMRELRGELRGEIKAESGLLRAEIANVRADILKWSFLFWVGQVAVVTALFLVFR